MTRLTRVGGLLALLLALLVPPHGALQAAAAASTFEPASQAGIIVVASRSLSARTWEIDIATRHVGPHAHKGALQVRVTLPEGYFEPRNSQKRYPVQYLLHGQGGRSSDWTANTDLERFTAGKDLIVVTPEGGSGGWYTNWVNQQQGPQNLEEFHIHQLVPFIDANLRTRASRDGRAISGFSMGGFGAMHYAGRHPDLFAYASSFSGGLNLDDPVIRGAVLASAPLNNLRPIDGSFGYAAWPDDANWTRHNPVRMAARYRGMGVSLYTGSGHTGGASVDLIEVGARNSTITFDKALTAAGVRHHFRNYGNPGTLNGQTCLGGHTWGCAAGAYVDDLPHLLAALAPQG